MSGREGGLGKTGAKMGSSPGPRVLRNNWADGRRRCQRRLALKSSSKTGRGVLWVDGRGMRMETVWSGWCLSGLGLFAIT